MSPRPFVALFALLVAACSSATQSIPDPHETTAVRAKETAIDPARLIENAATKDDPLRMDVHAHVVSHDDKRAIVEVVWDEHAPNEVEALDDATMHVVRRFAVRGDSIEAIAPKAWEVSDTLVACIDGRSDFLSGENVGDGCVVVPRGSHIEPMGESIMVPAPGPIPTAIAYRVRLAGDEKTYWTIPAHSCVNDVELEDGTTGRAIGSCSAIGDEEPELFRD